MAHERGTPARSRFRTGVRRNPRFVEVLVEGSLRSWPHRGKKGRGKPRRSRPTMRAEPHVFMELRPSMEGCYVRAFIEGVDDGLSRTYVGIHTSRNEAVAE